MVRALVAGKAGSIGLSFKRYYDRDLKELNEIQNERHVERLGERHVADPESLTMLDGALHDVNSGSSASDARLHVHTVCRYRHHRERH